MAKKRHAPPSRLRYEESHPTVSVRVSRELYDDLGELRAKSGKSLGDILREAVGRQRPSTRAAYTKGRPRVCDSLKYSKYPTGALSVAAR